MSIAGYEAVPELGLLYDHIPAYHARRDVAFYVDEAKRLGAERIIELGCGTGRVLIPLARAGHEVVGVDASAAMLDRCKASLEAEPGDVRRRVRLHLADVRVLKGVDVVVPLAIAPFRVLQHLTTVADQVLCLAAVARRLARDGRLVFDVFNPNFGLMTGDRSQEQEDTPEVQLPDGRFLRRTARVQRTRWVDQVSEVELVYYLRDGGQTKRHVQAFEMRWFLPAEIEHLLARAGFVVEAMHGDFDRSDLHDGAPEIIVVAAKS